MKKKCIWGMLLVIVLVILDQLSKNAVSNFLKGKSDFTIIEKVFSLSYFENTGAAFSLWTGKQIMLIAMTILVLLVMIWKYMQIPKGTKYTVLEGCFVLIVSGAVGNLIDRISKGYVVDFFYFIPIDFPKFNVADIYVTVGMVALIFTVFSFEEQDFDGLISIKGWK